MGCRRRPSSPRGLSGVSLLKYAYEGRTDRFGSNQGGSVKLKLTDRIWDLHFHGAEPIGVYCLLDSGHTTWACIDVDFDDYATALWICDILRPFKVWGHIESSRSKGWHVWIFHDAYVPAEWQRWLLTWVVELIGHPKMECNPKQAGGVTYGNYVRLPYPANHVETGRQVFWTTDGEKIPLNKVDTFIKFTKHEDMTRACWRSPKAPSLEPQAPRGEGRGVEGGHGRWTEQESAQYLLDPTLIIRNGTRDDTFFTLARILHGRHIGRDQALDKLLDMHATQCEDPSTYPTSAIVAKVNKIWSGT